MTSQEVEINEEVNLTCSAEAFPRPSIYWFIDGNFINSGVINTPVSRNILNSTLIISNASLNDAGFYYCSARITEFAIDIAWSTRSEIIVVGKVVILTLLCLLLLTNFHTSVVVTNIVIQKGNNNFVLRMCANKLISKGNNEPRYNKINM